MNIDMLLEEFNVVNDVFKRIAMSPWFSRDIARQHEFAWTCLRTYQAGITDPDKLFKACVHVARERYADAPQ